MQLADYKLQLIFFGYNTTNICIKSFICSSPFLIGLQYMGCCSCFQCVLRPSTFKTQIWAICLLHKIMCLYHWTIFLHLCILFTTLKNMFTSFIKLFISLIKLFTSFIKLFKSLIKLFISLIKLNTSLEIYLHNWKSCWYP